MRADIFYNDVVFFPSISPTNLMDWFPCRLSSEKENSYKPRRFTGVSGRQVYKSLPGLHTCIIKIIRKI